MKYHFDKSKYAFTRHRNTKIGSQSSYLYYFITANLNETSFNIKRAIGRSDHCCLTLDIKDKTLGTFSPRREIVYDFRSSLRDSEIIKDAFVKILNGENKTAGLKELIGSLRIKYKHKCKRKK